jgi:glycosyltransferase involved in cell wall biosynthesis
VTSTSARTGARPTFTICIPLYNAESTIAQTIESILNQTFGDFEVLVVDDCSTDAGPSVVRGFRDPRIVLRRNERNLGYAGNLARCFELATGAYVYLMGNDDVLSPVALERTHGVLSAYPGVALVTRPYYWFQSDDPSRPVRFIPPLDPDVDRVVPIDTDDASFIAVLNSISQLSGLAFRRDSFVPEYHPECFTAHVYPFLAMWKQHDVAFLRDYVLAVRIASSQTRTIASIYEPSPTWSWVNMFDEVFSGERYARQRRLGRDLIAGHVEGLVQVRCYAGLGAFFKEAGVLVRYRPANLASPKFWYYMLSLSVFPPRLIRRVVDRLKPVVTGARRQGIALARAERGATASAPGEPAAARASLAQLSAVE